MMIMQEKEAQEKKEAVIKIFTILFPDYQVIFTPNSLLFRPEEGDMVIVDESNFEIL